MTIRDEADRRYPDEFPVDMWAAQQRDAFVAGTEFAKAGIAEAILEYRFCNEPRDEPRSHEDVAYDSGLRGAARVAQAWGSESSGDVDRGESFNRWLATEKAKWQAEALREAQDELVRRDAFTERSLRILDELIENGEQGMSDDRAAISAIVLEAMGTAWSDSEEYSALPGQTADLLLTSDWLAAHDEQVRAEERERVAAAIEADDE